ncbi:hypothetical protein AVEN_90807-1 [Araneus ventricosus]|uniref:Uncharacterized protein n=1 Tax=Araneus ventricosus TaxID=182803 RepID=A0A4Y2N757_ARAVE|nr:hypothetical protein AVEN_90807-1 [Araneus ventricosus]
MVVRRQRETSEECQARLQANAKRSEEPRHSACASNAVQWSLSVYKYNSNCVYESESTVNIRSISCICSLCGAKKWLSESLGLCCSNEKVQLSMLQELPEPLKSLLIGTASDSTHFLKTFKLIILHFV